MCVRIASEVNRVWHGLSAGGKEGVCVTVCTRIVSEFNRIWHGSSGRGKRVRERI